MSNSINLVKSKETKHVTKMSVENSDILKKRVFNCFSSLSDNNPETISNLKLHQRTDSELVKMYYNCLGLQQQTEIPNYLKLLS